MFYNRLIIDITDESFEFKISYTIYNWLHTESGFSFHFPTYNLIHEFILDINYRLKLC